MKEYAANAEKHLSQNLADKYFVVLSAAKQIATVNAAHKETSRATFTIARQ